MGQGGVGLSGRTGIVKASPLCGDMTWHIRKLTWQIRNPTSANTASLMRRGKVFRTIWTLDLLTLSEQLSLKKLARTVGGHTGNARARNVGWRIDYWLASREIANRVTNPQIHPEQMGSDHCPVSIEVNL